MIGNGTWKGRNFTILNADKEVLAKVKKYSTWKVFHKKFNISTFLNNSPDEFLQIL